MNEITTSLQIDGMTCINCAVHIEKALEGVPGVTSASVELERGATVRHRGVNVQELVNAVRAAGDYKAVPT